MNEIEELDALGRENGLIHPATMKDRSGKHYCATFPDGTVR